VSDIERAIRRPPPLALVADDGPGNGLVGEVLADAGFEIVLARGGLELVSSPHGSRRSSSRT
jgi:hypothetical protein